MKTKREILEYYGKCCVSEYCLSVKQIYPAGEKGDGMAKKDAMKLENILGQKVAIEHIIDSPAC